MIILDNTKLNYLRVIFFHLQCCCGLLLTSWSSMLLEQRRSVAQPLGCSCSEVIQFPRSLSPGISGVKTSRLFLGDKPGGKKPYNVQYKRKTIIKKFNT